MSNHENVLHHSERLEILNEKRKSGNLEFFFPSIIALIVGGMALFGTLWAGKRQRESSERQLKEQLEQSQKTVDAQIKSSQLTLEKQINSAKQIADKQIDSSDATAELNFRQNVLSVNRQNWINTLRDIMSEAISLFDYCALTKSVSIDDYKKINSYLMKAELMVNPEKDKNFIESLQKLSSGLLLVTIKKKEYKELTPDKEEVIKLTKQTLKTEWERVKKGE